MKSVAFSHLFSPGLFADNHTYDEAGQEVEQFPITLGMNEKGSMTKDELDNFFMDCFGKLWPDKADIPGKRVGCLIDGGSGRTNEDGEGSDDDPPLSHGVKQVNIAAASNRFLGRIWL